MDLPPVVLFPGAIESSRALAAKGVRVLAAVQADHAALRASCSVGRSIPMPAEWDERLDRWFASAPFPAEAVILPGNDDAVWWLAARGHPAVATFEAVRDLTVKYRLYQQCLEAGLPAPRTWLAEPGTVLPAGPFPLVVKPQSRVGGRSWVRGRLVRSPAELEEGLAWFRREVTHAPRFLAEDPMLAHPIVQEYIRRPGNEVYHLTGYRSRDGDSVFAAHRKLLQYPRRFGNAACLESDGVDCELAAGLGRLLSRVGYHGIFEAEFVEANGRRMLIDLNLRPYNGLTLEVRRGYNLPWFASLEAAGESSRLAAELAAARASNPPPLAWCDNLRFWSLLAGQTVSGGFSPREAAAWAGWWRGHRHVMVDLNFARSDQRAGFAAAGMFFANAIRRPRSFLGAYVRRGLDR